MAAATDDPLDIEPPEGGRRWEHRRRIQLADGTPKGRVRLDALARMFQDISDEDTTDAGLPPSAPWVVRRVDVAVHEFPTFRDQVTVTTWCSGTGGRWAERRVRVVGDRGGRVEAAALWVHLDERGRPARLEPEFHELYDEAARGRKVRARLHHDALPDDWGLGAEDVDRSFAFPLRFVDFDLMGHVNNAVSWQPIEEVLAVRPELRAPMRVSVEHPASIEPGEHPEVCVRHVDDGFDLWIVVGDRTCSTARVRSGPG